MNRIKAVAFDLDGTLYLGDKALPGAVETVERLIAGGIMVRYFTNNSTRSRRAIVAKLRGLGFPVKLDDLYTSAYVAAKFLRQKRIERVWCVGTAGLLEELRLQGIKNITTGDRVTAVVVGLDPEFDLEKLGRVMNILAAKKILFLACNQDRNYPVGLGRYLPGCGPIVAAIENATGRAVDVVPGKPNTMMLELMARESSLRAGEILVVGDSYESDIAMARRYRSPALLIGRKKLKGILPLVLGGEKK
jgi:HAD superfamily hydrolase (TIGR01450 family)